MDNGSVYTGGIIKRADGSYSTHGQGNIRYADGSEYSGESSYGRHHGHGIRKYMGHTWEGQWDSGQIKSGELIFPDGRRFKGTFVEDGATDTGILTCPDGTKFEGQWKGSDLNSPGSASWPDGRSYTGEFKDGKMHGIGKMTYADGKVEEGVWRENNFVAGQVPFSVSAVGNNGSGSYLIKERNAPVWPAWERIVVSGITGGVRPIATINNLTFAVGEEQEVKVDGGKVKIRVLEIREESVVVKVEGREETKEIIRGNAGQVEVGVQKTTEEQRLSNRLESGPATFTRTEHDAKAATARANDEMAERDAKIDDLERKNDDLTIQMSKLHTSITSVESQIDDTKRKLAASEGDQEYLLNELKRLPGVKAELERKFIDLAVSRDQVRKLRDELSIARRLEWVRRGLYGSKTGSN